MNTMDSVRFNDILINRNKFGVRNFLFFVALTVYLLFLNNINVFSERQDQIVVLTLWFSAVAIQLYSWFSSAAKKVNKNGELDFFIYALLFFCSFEIYWVITHSPIELGLLHTFITTFAPAVFISLNNPFKYTPEINGSILYKFILECQIFIPLLMIIGLTLKQNVESGDYSIVSGILIILVSPFVVSKIRTSYLNDVKKRIFSEVYIDELTQVKNRKCFYDYYDDCRERNKVGNFSGLGMFFVDVDYFKKYNDHYGHVLGDTCLKDVADTLTLLFEDDEQANVYRYGGEEFLIVVECEQKTWENILNKSIIKQWKNRQWFLPLEHHQSPDKKVSLSGGASWFTNDDIYQFNAGNIVQKVDELLYKAKEKRAILCIE